MTPQIDRHPMNISQNLMVPMRGAGCMHQRASARADAGGERRRQRGGVQQRRQRIGFRRAVQGADRNAVVHALTRGAVPARDAAAPGHRRGYCGR